ncbi:hypothetical protein GQ457_02G041420 [Hibiscus cannabinus]
MTPEPSVPSEDSRLPKKQRRRDEAPPDSPVPDFLPVSSGMDCDNLGPKPPSYKDMLTGNSDSVVDDDLISLGDDDFDLHDDDIQIGESEGIPFINFSDRVKDLAIKSMDFTLDYPSCILAWVRLPDLPITWYKCSLIEAIGERIGRVVNIDYQTDFGHRGRFARMAIKINLQKPLVSKISINGQLQFVEYESLPMVCFKCGIYGHVSDSCAPIDRGEQENFAQAPP